LTRGAASLRRIITLLVRVPLHSGATAYWSVVRGLAALFVGGLLLAWLVVDLVYEGELHLGVTAWVGLVGLALIAYAWTMLARAWRTRPMDVLVGDAGLGVDRGEARPTLVPWTELDVERSSLERRLHVAVSGDLLFALVFFPAGMILGFFAVLNRLLCVEQDVEARVPLGHLTLRDRRGDVRLTATAEALVDIECLAAILELARSRSAPRLAPVADAHVTVTLVSCARCGAPCEPETYGLTVCAHCGHRFAPTDAVRAPLALREEAEEERAHQSERLGALLGRRDVASARRRILLVAACALATQVAVIGFGTGFDLPLSSGTPLLRLTGLGTLLVLVVGLVGAHVFHDRQAVHSVGSEFAACAPRHDREPPACRQCGAPLAAQALAVLVACEHCRAENVLGLELRRFVEGAKQDTRSLDELLTVHETERNDARRKSRWGVLAAAVLLVWFATEAAAAHEALAKYNVVWTKKRGVVRRRP